VIEIFELSIVPALTPVILTDEAVALVVDPSSTVIVAPPLDGHEAKDVGGFVKLSIVTWIRTGLELTLVIVIDTSLVPLA